MKTLQLNIQDDLVQHFGMKSLKTFLESELAFQRFKMMEAEIQSAMQKAKGVDWKKEFENARQEAFREYKEKRLK